MTEIVLIFGTLMISLFASVSIGAAFAVASTRRASKDG